MRKLLYIVIITIGLSACSEYQKVFKATDLAPKYKMAEALYKAGKYSKAIRLFEQIAPSYKGKPQGERIMYLLADSYYKKKIYSISTYSFKRFVAAYPESQKADEAAFLSVKSDYMLSPPYEKDQKQTVQTIENIQTFINLYPESSYFKEANQLLQDLEFKLEKKAFMIARQYDIISDYPAAIAAFDNFLFDYPGTSLREDALFLKLEAAYKLAMNSVEYKKQARLKKAQQDSEVFTKTYPESQHTDQVKKMMIEIEQQLKQYPNAES